MTSCDRRSGTGSPGEVFLTFLRLGLTSFGGPVAHLGYFRTQLVVRRGWIDEAGYAEVVALCQFLPGPASSQVGYALGLLRAGLLGGLAAWGGFTLPSALLMTAFAAGSGALEGGVGAGLVHGLKLVAVAVVAQAVWGMATTLTPDKPRAGVALAALALVVTLGGSVGQVGAIVLGAASGLWLCRGSATAPAPLAVPVSRGMGAACLLLAGALLLALPLVARATASHGLALFDAFYRSGALVFGGGHVVLPLLRANVVQPGWIDPGRFLAGYGAAQALPGPLFTIAAFLGAAETPAPNGLAGAAIGLVAISLPGLLLVTGALPVWGAIRSQPAAQAAMRGANAAVVGVLAAALYDPVWTSAVLAPCDFALAAGGFLLLTVWKAPPLLVVTLLASAGAILGGVP